MDDIFEKIIDGVIPADIVYEDDYVVAFLDNTPLTKGHTLVVPRKKFRNIFDADTEVLGKMMEVVKLISNSIKKNGLGEGVNIIMNNESVANQEVFHAHIHIVPRNGNENVLPKVDEHYVYSENESNEVCNLLKNNL